MTDTLPTCDELIEWLCTHDVPFDTMLDWRRFAITALRDAKRDRNGDWVAHTMQFSDRMRSTIAYAANMVRQGGNQ